MSYLAEQNVIGSLLLDRDSIQKVYNGLLVEMFRSKLLGEMYLEFLRGYDNGYEVNAVVLSQKMKNAGFPENIVQQEIKACITNTLTSASIESYANIVIQEYRANYLKQILQAMKPDPDAIDEQIRVLLSDLEALLDGRKSKAKTLAAITKENKGRYFKAAENRKIYLGFGKLDDLLGGLEGGDMIVVGARPAVGKSAFVTQIANNLGRQGKRVGFYNLEMQEKQIYERFVAAHSGIGLPRLRRAVRFLGDEEERFNKANEALEKQENIVITTGSKSVGEIRNECRHMGYDVIIIDYLQLLRSDKAYRGNRYAEVGAISKAIKALAMELNIPIIALSQLNRVSEMRETKEPSMAELREAGDIEQDASVIMLMWNLSMKDRSRKICKVEKQRQGDTGKVVMNFNGALMRFEESKESVSEASKWVEADECPFKENAI